MPLMFLKYVRGFIVWVMQQYFDACRYRGWVIRAIRYMAISNHWWEACPRRLCLNIENEVKDAEGSVIHM